MSSLTWKHGLDVPGEDSVQEGVKVHDDDGGTEAEVILLQRTRHQVLPLDPDALLLKQGKVLTAEPERHGGQEALRGRGHMTHSVQQQHNLTTTCSRWAGLTAKTLAPKPM